MLPFGLKIAFFVLSITGTVVSAVVLVAFGKAINVYWISVSYGLANFVLQAAVCLGLIWGMNPFLMPHWFCVTQTVLISFGAFLMTGICTCFSIATAVAVFRPAKIRDFSTLRWRNMYYLFTGLFPAVASAVQIAVIVKLDAVRPTDDLHCDATHPVWARFLGYAGVSLVLTVPSFLLSSFAIWKLFQAPRLFLSSCSKPGVVSSALPQLSFRSNMGTEAELIADTRKSMDLTSPDIEHTPISAHALLDNTQAVSPIRFEKPPCNSLPRTTTNSASDQGASSVSGTIPDFASNNSVKTSLASVTQRGSNSVHPYSVDYFRHEDTIVSGRDAEHETGSSVAWVGEATAYSPRISLDSALSKSEFDFAGDSKGKVPHLNDPVQMHTFHSKHASQPLDYRLSHLSPAAGANKSVQSFRPAIWRLLLFQVSFFLIECFAALSTIIDVAKNRKTPTPFGTQHVALILAAWGPFVVFSHLPAVRKQLLRPLRR